MKNLLVQTINFKYLSQDLKLSLQLIVGHAAKQYPMFALIFD